MATDEDSKPLCFRRVMEKGEPSWWSDAIEHFQNDDIMAECIKTYGTDGLKGRGDLFYTIVRSIIGQQISVIAA